MPFITELVVKWSEDKWHLEDPLIYMGNKDQFLIPEGFETDLASVPRVFQSIFPKNGLYTLAAVVHDWLYETKTISRKDADGIFRRIMRESGVGRFTRYTMWGAVRLFGGFVWKK